MEMEDTIKLTYGGLFLSCFKVINLQAIIPPNLFSVLKASYSVNNNDVVIIKVEVTGGNGVMMISGGL